MSAGISRNDPCYCGSGQKYKKCCLNKDEAEARLLTASEAEVFRAAAFYLPAGAHVPAIVCANKDEQTLFVVAKASAPLEAIDAAGMADDDLASTPGTTSEGLGPNCLRHLHQLGYRIMPGLGEGEVKCLDDLVDAEIDEDEVFKALLETIERQIREESPPEVRQTLVRLRRAGFERADVMRMIAHVMFHETHRAQEEGGSPDIPRYIAALDRLPALDCEHSE